MKQIKTDILVIGGGATGAGVAWDATLRGLSVVLIEKRDLTHGTTGRYHGLLHSGGRYAVKDPQSAKECIEENRILRQTHTHCIEDTSGFFVLTAEDDEAYVAEFVAGCIAAGIPYQEIDVAEALRREPALNRRIRRVFELPDGSADSFLATHATAEAAKRAGAKILTYHELVGLEQLNGRCVAATVKDLVHDELISIQAAVTINATGAWAAQVAAMLGIRLNIIFGKGIMLATNRRLVNTVINRCKMPDDGDILVPIQTVSVIGSTDEKVSDPEHLTIEPWEIELMLAEGEKLIPGFREQRILRAWAGVRPLYDEEFGGDSRDATRSLALLDHQKRDEVAGFITITGGKWTTFRLMAEKAVDAACQQLGVERVSKTATTAVAGSEKGYYYLGGRLEKIERGGLQEELICECELVTKGMIEQAVVENKVVTIDDLRRDVRLGMGPCQGGFCTYRAAGLLHQLQKEQPISLLDKSNRKLRDFLQERWKGVQPVLWGRQLQQERLDQFIYLHLFNADHLPEKDERGIMTDFYEGGGAE